MNRPGKSISTFDLAISMYQNSFQDVGGLPRGASLSMLWNLNFLLKFNICKAFPEVEI
jgi:hypothetical protein